MNKFWDIRMAKDKQKTGEMLIYGPIASTQFWGDEVTPATIKQDLDNLGDIKELNVYINSPGGSVFSGQAIYNILKRHPAQKTVYIDGLAASIASVVAMVGDKRIMPKNAMIMIHDAWVNGASGNAVALRKLADNLDLFSNLALGIYEETTKLSNDQLNEMMDAETWIPAEKALELGFITEIDESKEIAACLEGDFLMVNGVKMDFSRYKNPPDLSQLKQKKIAKEQLDVIKKDFEQRYTGPLNKVINQVKDDQVDENLVSLYQKNIDVKRSKFKYQERGIN